MRHLRLPLLMAVLLLQAALLRAQDMPLPALFDVSGVAADDVLNVRAEPGVHAPIIGTLDPDARNVEVVALSENGRWGRINFEEGIGWVSMRFMSPSAEVPPLPRGLFCAGVEPFWSLTMNRAGGAQAYWLFMGLPDDGNATYSRVWSSIPAGRAGDAPVAFSLLGERTTTGVRASGVIRREACSDGMTDRLYGLSVDVLLRGTGRVYVQGCCTLVGD